MLKVVILVLLALIIFFVVRTRRGLSKIDKIFNEENNKNIEQMKIEIQKRLNENKSKRRK